MDPFFWVEENGDNEQASTPTPRPKKKAKKRMEYVSWGSRELIEFLESVGKDTTEKLSHYDVTNIVNQYVTDNKLIHPEKKKRVVCDERLQVLFGNRKSFFRNKMHDLLEPHFVENMESEDDLYSSDEKEEDMKSGVKRPRKCSSSVKTVPKKKAPEVSKSCLVAICPENIKLVYLKRTLVQELLSNLETFESKVVGSFVRIKSDPHDIFQKHSHQLQLVTGINAIAPAGDKRPHTLLLSGTTDEISISVLSDDNFTEEECEDLRRRVKDGLFKQPTIGELEQKVIALHEDITKHWLARELALLKNLIDRANEKGWRHRVTEYLDRRMLLQKPDEQSRLLNEIPKLSPEVTEPEVVPGDSPEHVNHSADDSPKAADWEWEACYDSIDKQIMIDVSTQLDGQAPIDIGTKCNGDAPPSSPGKDGQIERGQVRVDSNGCTNSTQPEGTNFLRFGEEINGCTEVLNQGPEHINDIETVKAETNGHLTPTLKERDACAVAAKVETNGHMTPNLKERDACAVAVKAESNGHMTPALKEKDACAIAGTERKQVEVITLSDDEDEEEIPYSNTPVQYLDELSWHYLDPNGEVQGPFALTALKRWSDQMFFPADFRVWKEGQTAKEAILLTQILQQTFSS